MVVSLDWEKRFGRSGETQCPRVGTELEKDGRNIGRKEMQPAKQNQQNRREKEEGNARRRERKITQSLLLRPQGKGREQIPRASVSFPPPLLLVLAGNLSGPQQGALGTSPNLLPHTYTTHKLLWWWSRVWRLQELGSAQLQMSEVFQKSQRPSPSILPAKREVAYGKQIHAVFCKQLLYHEKRSQGTQLILDSGPTTLHSPPR